MLERRDMHDRRREERHSAAGRISWRKAGGRMGCVGWLSDRSRSSVSFIASAGLQPRCNQEVELTDADGYNERYRVTRVTAYDDKLSLIACRRLPGVLG